MKSRFLVALGLTFLAGCAGYKQLKPEPLLSPAESGYIELKYSKGKKDFEVKQEKKYFIQFPNAEHDNFYLVLTLPEKGKFANGLTKELVKKKTPGERITDEAAENPQMSVYAIGKGETGYCWLVEDVKEDLVLTVTYRYVPQWRFKFENRHATLKGTLESNRVDRTVYKTLGESFQFNGFGYAKATDTISAHAAELDKVLKELLSIESIFPPNILNSQDPAYLNYKKLKAELEEEIQFQTNYLAVIDFFGKEEQTRGNTAGFIDLADAFIKYFAGKEKLAGNVVKESQRVLNDRIREIGPYYDKRLGDKKDAAPLDEESFRVKSFLKFDTLHQVAGISPTPEFAAVSKYVGAFQERSLRLAEARDGLEKVKAKITGLEKMPGDKFFEGAVERVTAIQKDIPRAIGPDFGSYAGFICTQKLNEESSGFAKDVEKMLGLYREAQALVPQINALLAGGDYRGALGVLQQYLHLTFLLDKYKPLDRLSVEQQAATIRDELANYRWPRAEAALAQLHGDRTFLDEQKVFPLREMVVRDMEDSLYMGIDKITRLRVSKFLNERITQLENVDSLYTDSVFLPVYDVKFSSGSKAELIRRKEELVAHLAKMKENEFPLRAVKLLYDEFLKNPADNGVLKARACVTHGEHYKGDDENTKRRIAECNPWLSKWIVTPKKYRGVFALPLTDNRRGKNQYLVRINVRIPTDAKFPVYDVNIKLPKTVAQNASNEQWYDKLTLNKTLLKNEGRFTITAPTAESDYECQISPVRMDKDGNNLLDIYFTHPSFQVHTLSVMVQPPIIKKN